MVSISPNDKKLLIDYKFPKIKFKKTKESILKQFKDLIGDKMEAGDLESPKINWNLIMKLFHAYACGVVSTSTRQLAAGESIQILPQKIAIITAR